MSDAANPTFDRDGARLAAGDVAEIAPEASPVFGGAFMVVQELKGWGAAGFVPLPSSDGCMPAYVRFESRHLVRIGRAVWAAGGLGDESDGRPAGAQVL